MKFVFNDIFASDSNLFAKSEQVESVILASNLILEKNLKVAQVPDADFREMIRKYKDGTATDRARIMREDFPSLDESQQKDFTRQIETRSEKSSDLNKTDSISENVVNQVIEDAENTGVAGQNLNRILVERNKLVSRLRSSGFSPDEIARLFNDFMEKSGVPETLMITLLEDAMEYASQARSSYKVVANFMLVHYSQQRDADLTRTVVKLASQVKAASPDVPVFEMLTDAAMGTKPDISTIALIEDEDKRAIMFDLLRFSQLRVVEQGEEIRRQEQAIRDRLQMIQEQTNRQRGFVDILQTIEVNKEITKQIQAFGDVFVKLMTTPMYLALRSMLYDIAAARKILDAYGTLYIDNSPITPRQTDTEQRGRPDADSDLSQPNTGTGLFRRRDSSSKNLIRLAQAEEDVSEKSYDMSEEEKSRIIRNVGQALANVYIRIRDTTQFDLDQKGKERMNIFLNVHAEYWSKIVSQTQIDQSGQIITNILSERLKNVLASKNSFIKIAQTPQTRVRPVNTDQQLEALVRSFYETIVSYLKSADTVRIFQEGTWSSFFMINSMINVVNVEYAKQALLVQGLGGMKLPSQNIFDNKGNLTPQGMQILDAENQTNALLFATEAEQRARAILFQKRKANIRLVENTIQNLEKDIKMTVDLGDSTTGETPLSRPEEIKKKYEDFKKLLSEIIKQTHFEKDLMKRAFDRIPKEKLDPFKIKLIQNSLTDIDKDLKFFQSEYGKISSTALIILQISRKMRLMQKLGPLQKKIAKFKKAGLSTAALISSPNGFLRQMYLIRKEEEDALKILLQEYKKVSQHEKPVDLNSEIEQKLTTSTGEIVLPKSPNEPGKADVS